ncbi:hypothetical protein O3P69_012542 [Scylla paramamosain]|uniref:Uncharacterized protein n=1 Tax=Scylla paramamosain TaxID=85552 RepID=A0AAW0SJ80_SCYPA
MQDQRRVGTRAFDVRKGEVLCVQDRDKWNANTDTVDSLALAWRGAACGAAGPVPPCIASSPRHKKRINRCPSHRGRVKVPGGMSLSDLNDQHESPSTLQPSPSLADTSCFSQPCTIAITTRPVTTVHRDKHFVLSIHTRQYFLLNTRQTGSCAALPLLSLAADPQLTVIG